MVDSFEAFALLLLLLPGIVGYFVYAFVVDTKPTGPLTSLYLVLFFMLLTQVIAIKLLGQGFLPPLAGDDLPETERNIHGYIETLPLAPLAIAAALGLVSAIVRNKALDYSFLNALGMTHRVSERPPWNLVFTRKRGIWLTVRFTDGTALVGWPDYYSDADKTRELYLKDVTWYVPARESKTIVPANGCPLEIHDVDAVLLTNFDTVAAIEVKEAKEDDDKET